MTSPVRKIREAMLLTQLEFSKLLKVSRPIISQYETGFHRPRYEIIKKLLILARENNLDISAEDFFLENK